MIAQVIVDIKARQTDRSFEYHIPDQLTGVELGSRVYVPFGHRKLQGFVVGLREQSDYAGPLKDLLLVVDEQAPLTPELVELSAYLAQRIFAYRISLLLTMLPQVMRANYRKLLLPVTTAAKRLPLFQGNPVEVDQITSPDLLKTVRQLLKTGAARLEYVIENRAHEKTQYLYQLTQTRLAYEQRYETLPRNATVQRRVLQVLISDFATFPRTQADLSTQGLSTAALAQGVKKGWLTRSEVEVYRNPLAQVTPPAPIK
ncbi:MAG: primosomal protein N', partial [Lactobacillus sp.]|nr:primosomal protein N' [Lactobacillus sp.]